MNIMYYEINVAMKKQKRSYYYCSRCGRRHSSMYLKQLCEQMCDKIAESNKSEKPICK